MDGTETPSATLEEARAAVAERAWERAHELFAAVAAERPLEAEDLERFAKAAFWIGKTDHPVPADPRSGLHICFTAPDRASVARFHQAALAAGGQDNGAPGLRPDYGPAYYAAFVIDPSGYRIEAYCESAA